MLVFFFVGFQWIIILYVFCYICFGIGSNISNGLTFKLTLHMSWIVIFHRIMSPFVDHKHDKVMYMLCILKHMLSGHCQKFIIKLSKVCPCALKFMRQKARAKGN
jgi:hypothetical protein